MRVYLDNCAFNRPFDNQGQARIRLESEVKLFIQQAVSEGQLELAWSYILDYENRANPFRERRDTIQAWKNYAVADISETSEILATAQAHSAIGIKSKDALHIACAIEAGCDYFITTDDRLLRAMGDNERIIVMDPTTFIREVAP